MVCMYNGIMLSHIKEWNNTFAAIWTDLEIIILKWSKSERNRQAPYDITYMWNLKCGTSELIYETETDTDIENWFAVAKGKGGRGGRVWEFGIGRCKLLYTWWINNMVLLCSTENNIQYPVMNHNRKEYVKGYIFICIVDLQCINFFCIAKWLSEINIL